MADSKLTSVLKYLGDQKTGPGEWNFLPGIKTLPSNDLKAMTAEIQDRGPIFDPIKGYDETKRPKTMRPI